MGYVFAILAMVSFGALGLLSKLADTRGCSPVAVTLAMFSAAVVALGGFLIGFHPSGLATTGQIFGTAVVFGVLAMLSSWAFLYGLRFGKITMSWVLINLSAVVPTIASTLIYGERMTTRKLVLLSLTAVAIVLLWKDKEPETAAPSVSAEGVR